MPPSQDRHSDDAQDQTPEDAEYGLADPLSPAHSKAPDLGEKLTINDDTHDSAMSGEQEVIKAYGCLGRVGVSVCVLRADRRRKQEASCGESVAKEAQDVQCGEIYCETERRLSHIVGYGLWVEGAAPTMERQCELRDRWMRLQGLCDTYHAQKYAHPSTRDIARANASTSVSVIAGSVARPKYVQVTRG
jgi:hypothetical protein